MEEVEKNILNMRVMLLGDGEVEPNADQVLQLAIEVCNEDVIALFIHKLPILGWEARKNLVHCWSILLKQKADTSLCCVQYMETHFELLDFLVVSYGNKEIALHCGSMLRECIKVPSLAKYILESTSFELFFKFVELPNFDVSSDAFSTFKDLLTKHDSEVSSFLSAHSCLLRTLLNHYYVGFLLLDDHELRDGLERLEGVGIGIKRAILE